MTYLYGDSSASTIEIDYIEFLRRALDVLAGTLLAERDLRERDVYRAQLEAEAVDNEARLRELAEAVHELMQTVAEDGDTPPGRCAVAIDRAGGSAAEVEIARVRTGLAEQQKQLDAAESDQRSACTARWATLLAAFDLPDARSALAFELDTAGRYHGSLRCTTEYGVAARLELAIPEDHAFGRAVQVQRFAPDLELRTSGSGGGWLRKEPKVATHKLGKHFLARLALEGGRVELALRAAPELTCAGYDLSINLEERTISLREVDRDGVSRDEIAISDVDEPAMHDFGVIVALAARELSAERRSLVELEIDGAAIGVDGELGELVDRVVAAIAPVVRSIAERSLSESELVLRRQLGENRREEIFVSKAELAEKLYDLPVELQARFAALDLGPLGRAGTSELDPAMIVEVGEDAPAPPPPPGAAPREPGFGRETGFGREDSISAKDSYFRPDAPSRADTASGADLTEVQREDLTSAPDALSEGDFALSELVASASKVAPERASDESGEAPREHLRAESEPLL